MVARRPALDHSCVERRRKFLSNLTKSRVPLAPSTATIRQTIGWMRKFRFFASSSRVHRPSSDVIRCSSFYVTVIFISFLLGCIYKVRCSSNTENTVWKFGSVAVRQTTVRRTQNLHNLLVF